MVVVFPDPVAPTKATASPRATPGTTRRLKDPVLPLVGEPHVPELDERRLVTGSRGSRGRPPRGRRRCGPPSAGSRVQELEDALAGGHGRLEDVVLLAQVLDGPVETPDVLDEGHQAAQGEGSRSMNLDAPPTHRTRARARAEMISTMRDRRWRSRRWIRMWASAWARLRPARSRSAAAILVIHDLEHRHPGDGLPGGRR